MVPKRIEIENWNRNRKLKLKIEIERVESNRMEQREQMGADSKRMELQNCEEGEEGAKENKAESKPDNLFPSRRRHARRHAHHARFADTRARERVQSAYG